MTSVSKNVYINNLADTVDKYNNTYHRTIKIKPVDVKSSTYIDFNKENSKEDYKFKVGDHVYQNIKTVLQKVTLQIGVKKVLGIKELKKNLLRGHMLIVIFNGEEIIGTFYKKELQK